VDQSTWAEISAAIAAAPYPVEVLPADPERAAACLAALGSRPGRGSGQWLPTAVAWSWTVVGFGCWVVDTKAFRIALAGWETEVAGVALDQGISTLPPPWTTEGKDLSVVSRQPIRLTELIALHQDMARQLGFL
jgi:hypothetical protein